ncbi:hypothetical protein M5689_008861 [Euphorbia peplus]|nr:hypothetical protein M5689_008861 [Euphorbia peplus]
MASYPIFFAFFFLLSLLSIQIYARDAQFFNKVSPNPTSTTGIFPAKPTGIIPAPTTTTVKDDSLNNNQQQEQDPSFMQESQNAYGLYGQESNQEFPTTTKLAGNTPYTPTGTPSTYTPYNTPTQTQTQETYTNSEPDNKYYNNDHFTDTAYGEHQQQNLGENSFQESNYVADIDNQNNNKNNYYGYNGGFGNKNVERQGMSDTRFVENGKYFHDVNENNYYPNQYNQNSRNNEYDSNRVYSSSSNDENNNAYDFNNSMDNFQNQNQVNEQYDP